MNVTSMIVAGIAIFILGAVCGARMVYRFRHVTTKALHQALLNTLHERTARLDRLTEPARESTMVAIDGEETIMLIDEDGEETIMLVAIDEEEEKRSGN